ncbi:hypothetical protein HY837_06700 [archaeon]|nr:hypothetical protein [archaeon]
MNLPKEVIEVYGITGEVKRFEGGRGTTYLVGETVFKPVANEAEIQWIAETFNKIRTNQIRFPKYLRSTKDNWVEKGWSAYHYLDGETYKKNWKDKIRVCDKFHRIIKNIPCPDFIKKKNDPWSKADRIAWGEAPLECHEKIKPHAIKIMNHIKPISLNNQLIHGDIGGNILFSKGMAPAVIDFSPHYRPADFATAVLVVDALVWGRASEKILNLVQGKKEFAQLLLRAELRRSLEIGFCIEHFEKGNIDEINKHVRTIELLCDIADTF